MKTVKEVIKFHGCTVHVVHDDKHTFNWSADIVYNGGTKISNVLYNYHTKRELISSIDSLIHKQVA